MIKLLKSNQVKKTPLNFFILLMVISLGATLIIAALEAWIGPAIVFFGAIVLIPFSFFWVLYQNHIKKKREQYFKEQYENWLDRQSEAELNAYESSLGEEQV